jgi:hypothetical protein
MVVVLGLLMTKKSSTGTTDERTSTRKTTRERGVIASHNRRKMAWYQETSDSPQNSQMTAATAR